MAKPRALIVDDDANIRSLISTILSRESYDVAQAEDGEEAIGLLRDGFAFDVIVLDLMMPKTDGLGVVAYLEENLPQAMQHVVLMTAFAKSARERLGFICPILPKPFDLDNLVLLVRERTRSH